MTTRQRTGALGILLLVYLVAALLIGFWSTPVDGPGRGWLLRTLDALHLRGLPQAVDYEVVESAANVLFFVPLGILLTAILPRWLWPLAIIGGALFSCGIELGQLLLLPARLASWWDVAANSAGTTIGVAVVLVIRGIVASGRRPTQTERPAQAA